MRSVSVSACRISSMDSSRVCFASRVKPQFSCILACRKYWLIAVSSAVSCSFSSAITSLSPSIGPSWHALTCLPRSEGCVASDHASHRACSRSRSGGGRFGDRISRRLHDLPDGRALGEQRADTLDAGPAPGAHPAGRSYGLRRAGTRGNVITHVILGDGVADADIHPVGPLEQRTFR